MRLLDTGREAVRNVLETVGRGWSKLQERRPLSYDLLESDDAYLVVFDAPGVRGDDVQVQFMENTVEVRLDRFRDVREGLDLVFPGRGLTLSGSADLPADASVEPSGANATLTRSGTLQVEIPKDERAETVEVAEEGEDADADDAADADEANDAVGGGDA
ncbi:Hsp20/alpha crystallin family protein [Haloparvum sp. AD34]